jgi:hypothetical protein
VPQHGWKVGGLPTADQACAGRGESAVGGEYYRNVATNPDWNPLDDEIEEIFAANPGLRERLRDADVRYERGEATLHDHAEVVERLRRLGVPIGEDEPPKTAGH